MILLRRSLAVDLRNVNLSSGDLSELEPKLKKVSSSAGSLALFHAAGDDRHGRQEGRERGQRLQERDQLEVQLTPRPQAAA